jgi:hypothetical protein
VPLRMKHTRADLPKYRLRFTDQITDQSVPTCIELPCEAFNEISVLADA